MGGLGQYMPSTRWTYLLATLAISGIPLFSGFFSKDEILFKAFEYGYDGHTYAWLVWVVGIVTAVLTAFYMVRSYMLTFEGEERWPLADRIRPHESPKTMTVPLWTLGILSVIGGFIGLPGVVAHGELNWIHHFLAGEHGPVAEAAVAAHVPLALEWALIALGASLAFVGAYWAYAAYRRHGLAYDGMLAERLGPLYRWWDGKYYWDEFYDRTVVKPVVGGSRYGLAPFDERVVDGIVNGLARLMRGLGGVLRYLQTGVVQNYAMAIVVGVVLVMALMLFGS